MNIKHTKIVSFTDLTTWKVGHTLVVTLYKITKTFPREELYGLVDQMRRSGVSITSNIAEGFGRHGFKEKVQFFYLAQGSLTELKNQLLIAKDVGYLNDTDFHVLSDLANQTHQLLYGLIRKSKERISK
jgi:four helix bundle protein